ncbi:LOW QUALITY PROTEIN: ral guanine nucleotide dissociation stimulator-like 2 [Chelonoidis abingdonii]|uniref:LOW QUALITY PROTEIN: ral guanine nucleotide dissociation stimulator-like 2 n=1 Tax=Chelonoidis abingdonii TaxID=106734 RepID=UPI003F491A71
MRPPGPAGSQPAREGRGCLRAGLVFRHLLSAQMLGRPHLLQDRSGAWSQGPSPQRRLSKKRLMVLLAGMGNLRISEGPLDRLFAPLSAIGELEEEEWGVGEDGPEGGVSPRGDPDPLDILIFQADHVASQLTLVEAALFLRVVPYQCLGSLWSQRDKKGRERDCPSVRATVHQFNRLAGAVIRSCLARPGLRPQQRARILEKWIHVAEECRALRNFSSLCAIISALQSSPVHRLKRTWDETARDALRSYEELSTICSEQDNYSLSRQLLFQEGTSKPSGTDPAPRRQPRRPQEQRPVVTKGTCHSTCAGSWSSLMCPRGSQPKSHTPVPTTEVLVQHTGKLRHTFMQNSKTHIGSTVRLTYNIRKAGAFTAGMGGLGGVLCGRRGVGGWRGHGGSEGQGVVPDLGTFLRDLVMLDTAMKDEAEEFGWLAHCVSCSPVPQLQFQPKLPLQRCCGRCAPLLRHRGSWWWWARGPAPHPPFPLSPLPLVPFLPLPQSQHCALRCPVTPSASPQHMKWPSVSALDTAPEDVGSSAGGLSPPTPTGGGFPRGHRRSASCGSAFPAPPNPESGHPPSDCCIIRARMALHNGSLYKSILVTSQDKTPSVIAKVLEKHGQERGAAPQFQLVQLLPEGKELTFPPTANVFYAMNGSSLDFVLRPKSAQEPPLPPSAAPRRAELSATFPKIKATGRKLARALF